MSQREAQFVPYTTHEPACAVVAVTPPAEAHMHTYYDVCPWSPSGRYLACLRLPFEAREPASEDRAELCLIDLPGRTLRPVWETAGWGFQTAAHQAWGRTDRFLYFNDKRDDLPVGVRLDLATGQAAYLDGPVWQIHPDETFAISTCLIRGRLTQSGYGVTVRPEHQWVNAVPAAADDGLYRVDLATGRQTLLVKLTDVWEVLPDRDDLEGAVLYAFHCKFNPPGDRILLVVRARFGDGRFLPILTACRADGSGLRAIVGHRLWRRGGHHPIWHPNGRQVLMNLTPGDQGMRFCLIDAETGELEVLTGDPPGSGHPSISGRHPPGGSGEGKLARPVPSREPRRRRLAAPPRRPSRLGSGRPAGLLPGRPQRQAAALHRRPDPSARADARVLTPSAVLAAVGIEGRPLPAKIACSPDAVG